MMLLCGSVDTKAAMLLPDIIIVIQERYGAHTL